jgi:hypothetical protein
MGNALLILATWSRTEQAIKQRVKAAAFAGRKTRRNGNMSVRVMRGFA